MQLQRSQPPMISVEHKHVLPVAQYMKYANLINKPLANLINKPISGCILTTSLLQVVNKLVAS